MPSDSTAEDTPSERSPPRSSPNVARTGRKGRIVVTHSSNVPRIQQVVDQTACCRTVYAAPTSHLNFDYLRFPLANHIKLEQTHLVLPEEVVVMTTGCGAGCRRLRLVMDTA